MRTFITALGMTTLLLTAPCLAASSVKTTDAASTAPVTQAAPAKEDGRDQIKAKFKEQREKLKLTQKDQSEKLKADIKEQRDKLKAEQKQQRDKLKIAEREQLRKFADQQADAEDTATAPRSKKATSALR
ncbi:hypothetical protein [Telmatospirillum siberiense]|nr:hypothetical protein [Telmatospirillum siberiense]